MEKNFSKTGKPSVLITGRFAKTKFLAPFFFLLIFSFNLLAQVPTIDGNPADWPAILNNAANTQKAFRHDPFNVNHIDDSWTQGSQDGDASPSANWKWVYGNSNDKGDIGNAGAVLIGTRLYFFGDRSSFSGDAQIGFWFFLNNVQPVGDGSNPGSPFIGEHANGDLLIISNFTNGGGNAVPTIYRWAGKTATAPGGPVIVTNATAALSTNGTQYAVPGGTAGTSMYNGETWSFSPKSGTAGTYPSPLFFEGYVDLATISGSNPCFQRFLLETRNSQSIGASLQDLVAGAFTGIPPAPATAGGARCGPGVVNLGASGCTNGVLNWYATATSTTSINTGTSFSPSVSQTTSYYVSCTINGCESPRTQVTATIYPIPSVNGLVKLKTGVAQVMVGAVLLDDVYSIKLSSTNTADVFVQSPIAGATYTWTRINCTSTSAYVDDGKTTFSTSDSTGTFTVINTQGLAAAYCFQVRVSVDNGGGNVCTSLDTVEIRPTATAILCRVAGPPTVCAGATGITYILDGDANSVADALDPEFNYVWSISGGGGTIDGAASNGTKSGVNSITVTAGAVSGGYIVTLTISGVNNALQNPPPCSASTSVKLVTLSLDKSNVTCYGRDNGSVTATFDGGTAPYRIQINGGAFVDPATSPHMFSTLVAGNYTVRVIDINNCEASASIEVTQPDALDIVLTPTGATCFGYSNGSISAAITGTPLSDLEIKIDAGSYADVAASPVVFNGLAAGSHTITLRRKSDNSCLVSKSATVIQPDALDLALTPTGATCFGYSNGSISAAITGTPLSDLEIKIDAGNYANVAASPVVFNGLAAGSHTITLRRKSDNSCLVSKSATVIQPDALDLALTPTGATCYGVSNGSISAAITGTPLSDLEIKIDAGSYANVAASPVVFSGLAAGSHTITLRRKSDNSCLVSKSATVIQPDALDLALTPTGATCFGASNGSISAAITGTPLSDLEIKIDAGSYADVAASPVVFNGLAAGSHTITLRRKSDNSCLVSKSATVIQPDALDLALTPTGATCFGYSNGSISAAITGTPLSDLEIKIDAGSYADVAASPVVFSGLAAGSHTITLRRKSDNSCLVSKSATVIQPDALDLALTPTGATCYGVSNGSISAAITGTPLSDLEIKIDAGNYANVAASPVVFSGLAAGSHTITLRRKSDNSCLVSKSATVIQPDALDLALTPTGATCFGASNGSISAAITGTPLSDLEIKIDAGSYADVAASPVVFNGLAAGSHTITLRRKSDNSCLVSKSATVIQPDALDLALTPTGATCYGVSNGSISAAITGTPLSDLEIKIDAGSYADVAASPVVFNGLAAGSYTITLRRKSDNSCLVSKSATVTQPPVLTLSLTKGDVSCTGNDGSITATFGGGSGSYEARLGSGSWASATSPKTFSGLAAGSYTVYIRDANDVNCTISASVTLNNPTSCAHLFPTQTTCCNYLNGNTDNFQQRYICYSVEQGKVDQNANPGVFFYYGDFTTTATSNVVIVVRETRDILNKLWNFSAQNLSNVRLFSENCGSIEPSSVTLSSSQTSQYYDVTITANNLPAGKYVVSVKYDTKSIVGSPAGGAPDVTYSFSLYVNSNLVANSTGELLVTANSSINCSAPVPDGSCTSPVTVPTAAAQEQVSKIRIDAYPNPYAGQINFRFVSPLSGKAQLELFDLLGRKLDVLYSANVDAGFEKNILYNVPSSRMIPMIYRLTIGDRSVHGTVLPDRQ